MVVVAGTFLEAPAAAAGDKRNWSSAGSLMLLAGAGLHIGDDIVHAAHSSRL